MNVYDQRHLLHVQPFGPMSISVSANVSAIKDRMLQRSIGGSVETDEPLFCL
jgi:hypothetical protein